MGAPPPTGATREIPPELVAGLDARQRRSVRRCLTLLAVLSSASLLGVSASLYLATHQPLLLIALSPIGRHLILAAPNLDPTAFVLVAVTRRMLFYLACFHLGRAMGPAGIVWLEARAARAARFVRWVERWFARASRSVVLLMPGPTVSILAGSSGMRGAVFGALATFGSIVRMLILLSFAEWFREPLEVLLSWIEEYWVPGTVALVVAVVVYRWRVRSALPGIGPP